MNELRGGWSKKKKGPLRQSANSSLALQPQWTYLEEELSWRSNCFGGAIVSVQNDSTKSITVSLELSKTRSKLLMPKSPSVQRARGKGKKEELHYISGSTSNTVLGTQLFSIGGSKKKGLADRLSRDLFRTRTSSSFPRVLQIFTIGLTYLAYLFAAGAGLEAHRSRQ